MELGEGLCKLNLDGDDPFSRFREEVADVLQFLYRTAPKRSSPPVRVQTYHLGLGVLTHFVSLVLE